MRRYSPNPRAKRVEFRTPDPSCNGYLAFAAMLMAGLDGIEKRIDPGKPIDKNLYDLSQKMYYCTGAATRNLQRYPRAGSAIGAGSFGYLTGPSTQLSNIDVSASAIPEWPILRSEKIGGEFHNPRSVHLPTPHGC